MSGGRRTRTLPKDSRWVDLIPKLCCPQCGIYQSSNIPILERHVLLHCKCRPSLFKNCYMKELRAISSQTEDDVLDVVKLALEAKHLQWTLEGVPEIPLLLRHVESSDKCFKSPSLLLDLWRLWHQEMDYTNLEFPSADINRLAAEAATMNWEPYRVDLPPLQVDNRIDKALIDKVQAKMEKALQEAGDKNNFSDISLADIPRLQMEIGQIEFAEMK